MHIVWMVSQTDQLFADFGVAAWFWADDYYVHSVTGFANPSHS